MCVFPFQAVSTCESLAAVVRSEVVMVALLMVVVTSVPSLLTVPQSLTLASKLEDPSSPNEPTPISIEFNCIASSSGTNCTSDSESYSSPTSISTHTPSTETCIVPYSGCSSRRIVVA